MSPARCIASGGRAVHRKQGGDVCRVETGDDVSGVVRHHGRRRPLVSGARFHGRVFPTTPGKLLYVFVFLFLL